jgi:hypothetical protein
VIGAVAVGLRVLTVIGYAPANLSDGDTASYVDAARGPLFGNPFRPAGYSFFLRVVHAISRDLRFTSIVQHVVGLALAAGVYLVCRRSGAGRAVALVPAAIVAWSGDQLYLEHVVLSDGLFTTGVVLACYLALRVLDSQGLRSAAQIGLLVATSVTVAGLGMVRTIGVALIPVFLVWLAVIAGPGWRRRVVVTATAAIVCVVPLLGYAAAQQRETGDFGITRFGGWTLYARVAPFADCRDFTAPAGTAPLCQSSPASSRPGPNFYLWDPRSPARRRLGLPPTHGRAVTQFALAAIEHQPLSYLYTVGRDLARYMDPEIVTKLGWGGIWMPLNQRLPAGEAFNRRSVQAYFSDTRIHVQQPIMNFLEGWHHVFRIHGALIALSAVLSLVGIGVAPDARTRRALGLLVSFSGVLFLVPVAVNVYEVRYSLPGATVLLIAGARGAEILGARVSADHRRPGPVTRDP